ncbi:MAG TPA: hypothetical protein VHW00_22280 [Thermoanaerobaculia bacterium]|nr:hypothetical protein [Thermoanaerobaculia bacterium]
MDHANAVETYAAERYLLGELTDADAESFEEHYFECVLCAEDVRHGMQLMEGGRELARNVAEERKVVSIAERRQKRIGWMQLTAAAVLAVGIAVPQFVQRDEGRAWNGTYRRFDVTRSDRSLQTFKRGQLIGGIYEIQSQPGAVRYDVAIRDARGRTVVELDPVTAEAANDTQMLTADSLPVGKYKLSITGVRADGNRTGFETFEFQVVE